MTLKLYEVYGYEPYNDLMSQLLKYNERILTFFCGTLDLSGKSWCNDCTKALPVIESYTKNVASSNNTSTCHYVFVNIDKEEWKNQNSKFRTEKNLKLSRIPTLIWWENASEKCRLTEEQCLRTELIFSYFQFE